jgi:hypothetical protein
MAAGLSIRGGNRRVLTACWPCCNKRRFKNPMGELHIAVEMLAKLRPIIWKRIVFSLAIIGMVYMQFYRMPIDFKITINEIMTSALGLVTLFFVWIEYHFSAKMYRKYQDILISITSLKEGK